MENRKIYMEFIFRDGDSIYSHDLEEATEVYETFKKIPTIKKRDTYVFFGNHLIFLENVDEIIFNKELIK